MTKVPNRKVVMWRRDLLPGSETFIRNQLERLKSWEGVALGMKKIDSPLARDSDYILFGERRLDRYRIKVSSLIGYSETLRKRLKALQPDVVHAHFAMDAILIAPICRMLRIPLVVSVYGIDVTAMPARPGLKGLIYRKQLKFVFSSSSKVLAVSEHLALAARSLGASPAKVVVHRLGIDLPDKSRVDSDWEWDVLMVGRLIEKKGADVLISAVANLRTNDAPVRLAIVGDGLLKESLVSQAASLGASVDFLGALAPGDVQDVMSRSRMLAVPSKTAANGDSEGLPMILLEGAALGMPIVATRHSGIPEFIEHRINGLLSDENDIESLKSNIMTFIEDDHYALSLAHRGLEKVTAEYDIQTQAMRLEEFYDDAANGRS